MEFTLDRRTATPVVAVIGVWDPLVPEHRQLFRDLIAHARRNGLSSVAIVIDPAPPILVYGPSRWPVYNDIDPRIHLIRECGLDAVMLMQFTPQAFEATAADFFQSVTASVTLEELWLGAYQAIGSGSASSPAHIENLAQHHGVRLKRLPETERSLLANDVRKLLATGCIVKAARIIGRPPIVSRPREASVRMAWRPGVYQAVGLKTPTAQVAGPRIPIDVVQDVYGERRFTWPHPEIKYLAFFSGPSDQV
jgi:FAD synthase